MARKLLTMCSTHHRPEAFARMIKSYAATVKSKDAKFVCYVADCDPYLEQYKSIKMPKNATMEIGPAKTMVQVLNYFSCEKYLDFQYYSEVNDDHVYVTPGWDLKMMAAVDHKYNGFSVAYGQTQNMPTATMHGARFIRHFGYFFPPEYSHTFVDDWLCNVGFPTNVLTYVEDVLVDHVHWVFAKAHRDEVGVEVENNFHIGKKVFKDWYDSEKRTKDINGILEVIKNGKSITEKEIPDLSNEDLVVMLTTYDRIGLLKQTVASYLECQDRPPVLYVFDDVSKESEQVKRIISKIPEAVLIKKTKHLGFYRNNTLAMNTLFSKGAKKLLVLDSDCLLNRQWWPKSLKIANDFDLTKNVVCLFNARVNEYKPSGISGFVDKKSVGGLGLMLSKEIWSKYIKPIEKSDKEVGGWDGEMCVRAAKDGVRILACSPSLLQHTGYEDGIHSKEDPIACVADDFDPGITTETNAGQHVDTDSQNTTVSQAKTVEQDTDVLRKIRRFSFPPDFGPKHPHWMSPSYRSKVIEIRRYAAYHGGIPDGVLPKGLYDIIKQD